MGLAALLLIVVQRPWRWQIGRVGWLVSVPYGATIAAMNLCFYLALRTLPLRIAIAIEFLGPLAVAIIHSVRQSNYLWIACAAGGVASLTLPESGHTAIDPVGLAFVHGAALAWALYIVAGKRASEVLPEGRIVCLGTCVAGLIAVSVGAASAGARLLQAEVLASVAVIAASVGISDNLSAINVARRPCDALQLALTRRPVSSGFAWVSGSASQIRPAAMKVTLASPIVAPSP